MRVRRRRGGRGCLLRESQLRRAQAPAGALRVENNGYAIHTHQRLRQRRAGRLRGASRRSASRANASTTATCCASPSARRRRRSRCAAATGVRLSGVHDVPLEGTRRPGRRLEPRLPRSQRSRAVDAQRPGGEAGGVDRSGAAQVDRRRPWKPRSPTPSRSRSARRSRIPARSTPRCSGSAVSERDQSYVEALREAALQEMERDRASCASGSTWTTRRRSRAPRAVWSNASVPSACSATPLAEDAMTGVAIGMALAGLRPIHVHNPHGLPAAGDEPARQHRRQDPLHVRGARAPAARRALDDRQEAGGRAPSTRRGSTRSSCTCPA